MFVKKNKILYSDWIYEWLIDKKEYIKESTYANYSNSIFNHIIPKLGDVYIRDLNHKIIQDFLLYLYKNGRKDGTGGLSEKTIKDITIIIKGSIKKAINEEKIKHFELSFIYPRDNKDSRIYILSKYEQKKLTNYILENLNCRNIGLLIALYSGLKTIIQKGEVLAYNVLWRDGNQLARKYDLENISDKVKFMAEVLELLVKISNSAERDIYIKEIYSYSVLY